MSKCKKCGTIGEHDCGLESMKNMVAGFAEAGVNLTVSPMTNPSSEFEKRLSEAAKRRGYDIWHPMLRSMLPSRSRGQAVDETMQDFKAGAHYGIGAVIEWLRSEDEMGSPASQRVSNVIEKRFQSGQARDGGKENG